MTKLEAKRLISENMRLCDSLCTTLAATLGEEELRMVDEAEGTEDEKVWIERAICHAINRLLLLRKMH